MNDPSLAVLISGGLDSAILLGDALRQGSVVHPLYVRFGLAWEDVERAYLVRYLAALACPALMPLTILECPVSDVYGSHWSITGVDVPLENTPDELVFLPGRNVFFLSKAMLWCQLNSVPALALGTLQSNPFPDATVEFFRDFPRIVNQALGASVQVRLPFGGVKKTEVMKLGRGLPLEHTFSCIRPRHGLHCGTCSKCGERKQAFAAAAMSDPTPYFTPTN